LARVVTAQDRVSTQLEVLEILPPEQMAELLAQELENRGFERRGTVLVREQDGVTLTVEPMTGTVTVQIEGAQQVHLESEREGRSYEESGAVAAKIRQSLQEAARKDLEQQADQETAKLQTKLTDQLEGMLGDLRKELDQAVNHVTAEAL